MRRKKKDDFYARMLRDVRARIEFYQRQWAARKIQVGWCVGWVWSVVWEIQVCT